jgi:hypothetical protein
MRKKLKHKLSKVGISPYIDLVRRLPNIVRWLGSGCSGPAPGPIKRRIIAAYIERYGIKRFIETGTHEGDTLAYVAMDRKIHCSSIELSDYYYNFAVTRFDGYRNVDLFNGDSGLLLPQIVTSLSVPAVFWLDGHYSGGKTARGSSDTPISGELKAILDSPIKQHVILIDDIRLFNGTAGYPELGSLLSSIQDHNYYEVEVTTDIVRLTPRESANDT